MHWKEELRKKKTPVRIPQPSEEIWNVDNKFHHRITNRTRNRKEQARN